MLHAHRAQVSVEFLSMIGVVLIVFLGLYAIIGSQNRSINDVGLQFSMQRVCNGFSTAINLAAAGGSGFSAHITLPNRIKNLEYNISRSSRTLLLNANGKFVNCRLITNQVIFNTDQKGKIDLKNINGTIYIEEA
ncbi:TPA: hypothetical protein H1005_02230 [archaeon]|uniref:Uncharacterized protein n=1 Tax=Candidatus Naiadarchaeum limnaeum TaxID=2756139 RepID=A0A832V3V1_9ARCH|nr:hypothetical protein [Candidatus Naiadarchaeales archaeon SRR2090153.bin1042]HIK00477.1 hypothetical protein [Candidatus Naiadarchaeum limnaeum]